MQIKYLAVACLVFITACVPEQDIIEENPFIINQGDKPWIIAHGGAKKLWPENTLLAMQGAYDLGVDALEMDVNLTKDNILVLRHDATIDRMSDGTGEVIGYTLRELRQYNYGYNFEDTLKNYPYRNQKVAITTLDTIFELFPNIPLVIEIKNEGENGKKAADKLKEIIDRHNSKNRVLVASFHDDIMDYYLEITNGEYFLSTASGETKKMVLTTKSATGIFYKPNSVATQIPMKNSGFNLAKKRIIKSAHRHNMAVHYWTINDQENMKKLIEMGADGLITDRPDIMKRVIKQLGL